MPFIPHRRPIIQSALDERVLAGYTWNRKGGSAVKIDVELDPSLTELRVKVLAPGKSEELAALLARLEEPGRLTGFRNGEASPLEVSGILRFYGEDKEVRAQTAEGVYTIRLRLYELEERLDSRTFVRVSHSEIVNWKRVTALDLKLTGTIRVTLEGGITTYASRRYVKKIKEVLGL